jgi:hypothetical protein
MDENQQQDIPNPTPPPDEPTTLVKYQREIAQDTKLDRVIVEEVQLKLPGLKAKWQSRLANHKTEIDKLTDLYDDALETIAKKIEKESPIQISIVIARKQAENHALITKIKKQIRENTRIVEFLENINKTFATMTYDVKNVIDLIKQETM